MYWTEVAQLKISGDSLGLGSRTIITVRVIGTRVPVVYLIWRHAHSASLHSLSDLNMPSTAPSI